MSTEGLSHHISSRYNEDLERLRSSVLEMGGLVERQLSQAIGGITEPDVKVMLRVAQEELRVNQLERSIDEDCSRILATRAPTASDLRFIITILKTITDLERIGDEGEKVAAIAARLAIRERPANRYRELRNLGDVVSEMLHDTLDAFARRAHGYAPCKLLLDSLSSQFPHFLSFLRSIQQPDDFGGKICNPIILAGIERCFLGTKPPLLRIELHNWLAESHIFHNLDHRRQIVHLTRAVRIHANISGRQYFDQVPIRNSSSEINGIF